MAVLAEYLSDQLHKGSLVTSSKSGNEVSCLLPKLAHRQLCLLVDTPLRKQASQHPC